MKYYYQKRLSPYLEHYILTDEYNRPVSTYINSTENPKEPNNWFMGEVLQKKLPPTAIEITKEEFEGAMFLEKV